MIKKNIQVYLSKEKSAKALIILCSKKMDFGSLFDKFQSYCIFNFPFLK